MPRKAKRPCAYPGCPKLAENMYCEEHAAIAVQERLVRQRQYNRYSRNPEVKKKYNRNYRTLRDIYFSQHPYCEECARRGIIVPAKEVHHIIPVKWGGTHSFDNFRSLCQSCHTKIEKQIGSR